MPPISYVADTRELVSIAETARLIGLGRSRVYDLLNQGDLRTVRIGGRRLVIRQSISDFVRRLEVVMPNNAA